MRNAAVKGEAAMAYGAFADIYDAFNEDADYAALTSYVRTVSMKVSWQTLAAAQAI